MLVSGLGPRTLSGSINTGPFPLCSRNPDPLRSARSMVFTGLSPSFLLACLPYPMDPKYLYGRM